MLVKDTVKKTELDLSTAELIDLVANGNRQVDLVFDEKQSDEDGYLHWDRENWTSVDGKRFIRSYFLDGRALSDFSGYNKYDMKGYFQPEKAKEMSDRVYRSGNYYRALHIISEYVETELSENIPPKQKKRSEPER